MKALNIDAFEPADVPRSQMRFSWPKHASVTDSHNLNVDISLDGCDLEADEVMRAYVTILRDTGQVPLARTQALALLMFRISWLKSSPEERAIAGHPGEDIPEPVVRGRQLDL